MTPTPTVGEVRAVRIEPQLADVLAELPYRRGPGADDWLLLRPRRGVGAADEQPVPPG
jgi:hypothetical protein